jgi:uncharacterized protein
MLQVLFGGIVYILLANIGSAASFDCGKAKGYPESLICSDSELSMLDEYLGRYYQAAMQELGEGSSCLKADQRQWLKTVRNACRNSACLKQVYLERLGELDLLQPGVTAIKNLDLSSQRSLIWIIPPAPDTTAVSKTAKETPFVVSGMLINELDKGDGISIRTNTGGESYPVIQLMLADGGSVQRLIQLTTNGNAPYTVRGSAAADESGKQYFDPGKCVYIYETR